MVATTSLCPGEAAPTAANLTESCKVGGQANIIKKTKKALAGGTAYLVRMVCRDAAWELWPSRLTAESSATTSILTYI